MDTKNTKRGGIVGKLLMAAAAGCLAGTVAMTGCGKEKEEGNKAKPTTEQPAGDKAGAAKAGEGDKAKSCSGEGGCGDKAKAGEGDKAKSCSGEGGCGDKAKAAEGAAEGDKAAEGEATE